jgi:hypothetical protein
MNKDEQAESAKKNTLKYYGGLSREKVLGEFRKWDITVLQQLNDIAHPKEDRVVRELIQKVLTERKANNRSLK